MTDSDRDPDTTRRGALESGTTRRAAIARKVRVRLAPRRVKAGDSLPGIPATGAVMSRAAAAAFQGQPGVIVEDAPDA